MADIVIAFITGIFCGCVIMLYVIYTLRTYTQKQRKKMPKRINDRCGAKENRGRVVYLSKFMTNGHRIHTDRKTKPI